MVILNLIHPKKNHGNFRGIKGVTIFKWLQCHDHHANLFRRATGGCDHQ